MDKQRAHIRVYSGAAEGGIAVDVTDPSDDGNPTLSDECLFAIGDVVLDDFRAQSGLATHPNDSVQVRRAKSTEIDRP